MTIDESDLLLMLEFLKQTAQGYKTCRESSADNCKPRDLSKLGILPPIVDRVAKLADMLGFNGHLFRRMFLSSIDPDVDYAAMQSDLYDQLEVIPRIIAVLENFISLQKSNVKGGTDSFRQPHPKQLRWLRARQPYLNRTSAA